MRHLILRAPGKFLRDGYLRIAPSLHANDALVLVRGPTRLPLDAAVGGRCGGVAEWWLHRGESPDGNGLVGCTRQRDAHVARVSLDHTQRQSNVFFVIFLVIVVIRDHDGVWLSPDGNGRNGRFPCVCLSCDHQLPLPLHLLHDDSVLRGDGVRRPTVLRAVLIVRCDSLVQGVYGCTTYVLAAAVQMYLEPPVQSHQFDPLKTGNSRGALVELRDNSRRWRWTRVSIVLLRVILVFRVRLP